VDPFNHHVGTAEEKGFELQADGKLPPSPLFFPPSLLSNSGMRAWSLSSFFFFWWSADSFSATADLTLDETERSFLFSPSFLPVATYQYVRLRHFLDAAEEDSGFFPFAYTPPASNSSRKGRFLFGGPGPKFSFSFPPFRFEQTPSTHTDDEEGRTYPPLLRTRPLQCAARVC